MLCISLVREQVHEFQAKAAAMTIISSCVNMAKNEFGQKEYDLLNSDSFIHMRVF